MDKNISTGQIEEFVSELVKLAKDMTCNRFSTNYEYILREIKNSSENYHEQRKARKRENDRKTPTSIENILPILNNLYTDIYDLNFHIYKARKRTTIVEISYYLKYSLEPDYRQKISGNLPMIHCKVTTPPWLSDKQGKFDINWEHKEVLTQILLLWQRIKFRRDIRQ